MIRPPSLLLFFVCLVVLTSVPLYAGQVSLSTYYPAPSGNYNDMKVNNALRLEPATCPSLNANEIALINNNGIFSVCPGTPPSSGGSPLTNFWQLNGTNLSPININYKVGIGRNDPVSTLDVVGNINASTGITSSGGDIAASNGNITASGNITATNGVVSGGGIRLPQTNSPSCVGQNGCMWVTP